MVDEDAFGKLLQRAGGPASKAEAGSPRDADNPLTDLPPANIAPLVGGTMGRAVEPRSMPGSRWDIAPSLPTHHNVATPGPPPPPVLGLPPHEIANPTKDGRDEQRHAEEGKRRHRMERVKAASERERADRPDSVQGGVQAGRLLEILKQLLILPSPPGHEIAAARFVQRQLDAMGLTWVEASDGSEGTESCGSTIVDITAGSSDASLLLMVAHLDCDDPPATSGLEWNGRQLRSREAPAGLHARAGCAVLLEFLHVVSERQGAGATPPCALRAVFTRDGEVAQGGIRSLDRSLLQSSAGLCLDGYLVDELLVAPPWSGGFAEVRRNARAARRQAEQALSECPQELPADVEVMGLAKRVEQCLSRIAIPSWTAPVPFEATAASVLVARGVPAIAIGTGVIGAHVPGETFILSDAVLCARLLLAVAHSMAQSR